MHPGPQTGCSPRRTNEGIDPLHATLAVPATAVVTVWGLSLSYLSQNHPSEATSQQPRLCGSRRQVGMCWAWCLSSQPSTGVISCQWLVGIRAIPKQFRCPLLWKARYPLVESPHWGSRFLGPSCSQQKEQLQPEESWQPRLPLLSTSSSESATQRLYQLPPPAFPKCLAGNRRGRATLIPSKAERLASSLPLWGSQGAMAFSLKSSLAHLGPVGHHNPQVPPPQTGQ